jgi:hypothetical protein
MKKAILITTMVFVVTLASAQERMKELGLAFYNFDGFGLNYKVGTPDKLWRLNSMYSGGYRSRETFTSSQTDRKNFGTSLRAGREFRKNLAEDFEFRYGFDVSFGYDRVKIESRDLDTDARLSLETQKQYIPGVNAVLGINYLIRNKIVLGAELLPGVSYRKGTTENLNVYNGETTKVETTGFSFGASSSSVLLVIAYRF